MNRRARLRWRLAAWIAPTPIIAPPLGDGPAILLRDSEGHGYGWVSAKTLDLEMHNDIRPLTDDHALVNFQPSSPGGTFSGTI